MVASKVEAVEVNATNNVCEYKAFFLLLNHMVKERWFIKKILIIMDA